MSDSASWYQRKMAQMREAVQPFGARQPMQPQQFPQQPFPQQTTPYPQQQYPQQQLRYQPEQPVQPPQVTMDNLWGAMHLWKGGVGHKMNPDPCPNCGSNQWFEHVVENRRGPSPAGHCYNCGYNGGMFTQGDQANWAAAANQ